LGRRRSRLAKNCDANRPQFFETVNLQHIYIDRVRGWQPSLLARKALLRDVA